MSAVDEKRPMPGACSPGEYLAEELAARGWTSRDLAVRMALVDAPLHELAVDLLQAVSDKSLVVDGHMSRLLGGALGVSEDLFASLSKSWSAS